MSEFGSAAPQTTDLPGRGTIVVRGDLFSDTGYGRATRALSHLLAECGRHLFGVSLHDHPARRTNPYPFVVIPRDALGADPRLAGCCIVNVCLPNDFVSVPLAHNVGYFFWETDQFPLGAFWKAKLSLMDDLWAPSTWQVDVLKRETRRQSIALVPWPQGAGEHAPAPGTSILERRAHPPQTLDQLSNFLLRLSPDPLRQAERAREQGEHEEGRSTRFDPDESPSLRAVLAGAGDIFVAVQTDAPRKGLNLLLAAWLQFRGTPEGRRAKLLIKMSSIDVTIDLYRLHFNASLALRRAMNRLTIEDAGVYFVYDRLTDGEMNALVGRADAFVSATMGEGFGGPLAEAFAAGVPVICPDHTSCSDIIGSGYPLSVACAPHRHKLWQNIDAYSPSSIWHVADDRDMVKVLQTFSRMNVSERRALAERAYARIISRMGDVAVGRIVADRLRPYVGIMK